MRKNLIDLLCRNSDRADDSACITQLNLTLIPSLSSNFSTFPPLRSLNLCIFSFHVVPLDARRTMMQILVLQLSQKRFAKLLNFLSVE